MQSCVSDFLDSRIEEIVQSLPQKNGVYSLAVEKRNFLFDSIHPIMQSEREITLSAGDCENFREYFEQELEIAAIMEQELYRQGYLDCVQLLVRLGLLAGREERL